jgi:hypothetical protein
MSIVEAVTFAIAILGAALGIINTWHGLDKSRVKLRVIPKHVIPLGDNDQNLTFCIEVTNLSSFAVTVDDVGVFYKDTDKRGSITHPVFADGGKWPRRLDPRSSVTIYAQSPKSKSVHHAIKCAYARTECGVTKTGNSPALKQISQTNYP